MNTLWIAPVMVLLVVGAFVALIRIMSSYYLKVSPNEVLVIYGRTYTDAEGVKRGFRLVCGGAAFCIPILEKYKRMSIEAFQIKFSAKNVPSKDGVRVTVDAVASLKIGSDQNSLFAAVSRFLDMTEDQVDDYSSQILEAGLRGVVATMSVEELVKERTSFGSKVQDEVVGEFSKIGIQIDSFLIQEISDTMGYIDALGKTRTAEVQRDATIGEAAALRESDEKASASRMAGETAKAVADTKISDAARERDLQIAQNFAKVDAEKARAAMAAEIASAERDKDLRIAQVAAQEAEVIAKTALALKEKQRRDAELDATIVVNAEREKEAALISADATRQAAVITAEGQRKSIEILADADKSKVTREAEAALSVAENAAKGTKASAEAHQAQLEAEAAGSRAKFLAEAAGIEAKYLAEATGIEKKAEAYAKLDSAGRLLMILEHAPTVLSALGKAIQEAGEGTVAPMARAIGDGLAGIDEVRIVDLGGGSANGGEDALSRYMGAVPKSVFSLVEKAKSLGYGPVLAQFAQKMGIDTKDLKDILEFKTGEIVTETPSKDESEDKPKDSSVE